ncbi:MAG: hypothetical protein ACRD96_18445 [Bryobacteraceae bacterium]
MRLDVVGSRCDPNTNSIGRALHLSRDPIDGSLSAFEHALDHPRNAVMVVVARLPSEDLGGWGRGESDQDRQSEEDAKSHRLIS